MSARKAKRQPKESRFRVGDAAIVVYNLARNQPIIYPPGSEVRVVEALERRESWDGDEREVMDCYGVLGTGFNECDRSSEDYIRYVRPDQLKKPGREDPMKVVRWNSCPWSPARVKAKEAP